MIFKTRQDGVSGHHASYYTNARGYDSDEVPTRYQRTASIQYLTQDQLTPILSSVSWTAGSTNNFNPPWGSPISLRPEVTLYAAERIERHHSASLTETCLKLRALCAHLSVCMASRERLRTDYVTKNTTLETQLSHATETPLLL